MKISFKTYFNDRLKQVYFHGVTTHPLYVQLTYERRTIFFKSYYFELLSKERYLLTIPGTGIRKGPDLLDVIKKETEVIKFITARHPDDFSLELFKKEYAHYSIDLCDEMESGFINYLHTFFSDEGMPALGDIMLHGSKNIIAFDAVRDMKSSFNKTVYDKLIENSFYYAPPYLPVYGFMKETKQWPILLLTVMEWEQPETHASFREYASINFPGMDPDKLFSQVNERARLPVK
ncbi:MAG: hypothetical protein M3O71_00475 [Bacteroidota bacterium]|nr:hypothetical protein [Bacteroidota bacterium]